MLKTPKIRVRLFFNLKELQLPSTVSIIVTTKMFSMLNDAGRRD